MYCDTYFHGCIKIPIIRILGGDRFDLVFEACEGKYWKRQEVMKCILYVFPMPKNYSIMQLALYFLLHSIEMIAYLRVGAIYIFKFIVPMRWLSAKTHLLAQRKWGENHMASAIDCVYKTFQKIKERPALILQNTFMMNISQSCTDICLS